MIRFHEVSKRIATLSSLQLTYGEAGGECSSRLRLLKDQKYMVTHGDTREIRASHPFF